MLGCTAPARTSTNAEVLASESPTTEVRVPGDALKDRSVSACSPSMLSRTRRASSFPEMAVGVGGDGSSCRSLGCGDSAAGADSFVRRFGSRGFSSRSFCAATARRAAALRLLGGAVRSAGTGAGGAGRGAGGGGGACGGAGGGAGQRCSTGGAGDGRGGACGGGGGEARGGGGGGAHCVGRGGG